VTTQTDALAAAALNLTEAIRASTSNPLDAIRLLISLMNAPLPNYTDPFATTAGLLTAALFRRCCLTSMAMASADYQPASSTEANALIAQLGGLFDTEILAAADAEEDATYGALRDLRAAVIADLRARSASLPELITVALPGNLPSLAAAYRLYQDSTREPGMVNRANVIHPGFMPPSFEALSA
jgi:prophage DNA circulation protein